MEFRKMVDHPGILQDSILALLSHLYLGRAQLMMEDKVAARKGGDPKIVARDFFVLAARCQHFQISASARTGGQLENSCSAITCASALLCDALSGS